MELTLRRQLLPLLGHLQSLLWRLIPAQRLSDLFEGVFLPDHIGYRFLDLLMGTVVVQEFVEEQGLDGSG